MAKLITITASDYRALKDIQIKYRMDWPAAFSANPSGDLWLFAGRSFTHPHRRVDVRGLLPVLDQVADVYTVLREEGGRFFVDSDGVYRKDAEGRFLKFVEWKFESPAT